MRVRDYQPGEQVPGTVYKILRLIGAGGMGTVYDVEDTTIGKRYVLKTLHPKLGAREDLARRIQNEARTLARLNHPNIVEVITAGVTADTLRLPYYLMERLSGQSLRVVLEKKGQLELAHAYHIGIDLLDALDHAHDKGVIHRDVKPDNIFLHRTMAGVTVTKLLDFGIVSMLDASSSETAGRFLGTLRYAAPEQLRGEKPTAKTDVYSAGLVLYEIIAGRGPFDDEGDAHKIAAAHMNKFPHPVSQFVSIPRELDVLLMAALAKNPDVRPRDAFSFAASLRNLKRRAEEARPRESTDNRVTVAAVIGPESLPSLPSNSSSPVPAPASTARAASPSASSFPKTTLVGMHPPTLAPARTSPFPFATTHDARDRVATSHSLALDTLRTPQNGTEALPPEWPPALPLSALEEASTEIQWPRENAPVPSIEPQVRSLSAPASRRAGRRLLPILVAAAATFAIVVAGSSRWHGSKSAGKADPVVATSPLVTAPIATSSESEIRRVAPVPSSTAEQVIAASSASAAPVDPPPLTSISVPPPRKATAPAKTHAIRPAPPSSYAPDRPGPGF